MELFITFLAGLSVLLGALLVRLTENKRESVEHISLAMALSALLALLVFDIFPELTEITEKSGLPISLGMTAFGIVLLIVLDRFVPDHEDTEENHDAGNAVHIGLLSALALVVHNIVEGMSVYGILGNDLTDGIIFAIGISLHNIPMGMMIFSTMATQSKKEKTAVTLAVTLSTLFGGLIMFALSGHLPEIAVGALLSVACGMIIYITFLELLPHVIRTKDRLQSAVGIILGFGLVLASVLLGG
ncbi:MAG: ZIP family metal transporter [Lachnospiraceae bacterium]|nr:ZIP family metal transporter [Lachnospiraceae bacterium]